MMVYNPNLDLVNVNVYTRFGQFLPIIIKLLSKTPVLSCINQGRNSVAKGYFHLCPRMVFFQHYTLITLYIQAMKIDVFS